jgi:glycerol-3-phosphate acyltransferase PlsX
MIKVSIDAFGGDFGTSVTIPAGIDALNSFADLFIYFVGDEDKIKTELAKHNTKKINTRFEIIHASEVVAMDDKPSIALRRKKDSSMRVAINLVKDNTASACVSAGNTGALMAISRFVLKTIRGIDRPAIMAKLPTFDGIKHHHTHMLDLGANVDSNANDLLEFAVMGSVAISETENIKNPTVGLLNIGEEEVKGNETIKQTAELLKNSSLNYYGFVEGDDIYKGAVDVVVCDGFEGNIALKASEGVVKLMSSSIKEAFTKNIFRKMLAMIAMPALKDFKSKIDPGQYNGASLLGLKGVVIKSHGGASIKDFWHAIAEARIEAKNQIADKIADKVEIELEKSINNNVCDNGNDNGNENE